MNLAFLFPGQGAQSVGMGRALAERFPEARAVFESADRVLGYSLSRLCWEGPAEELRKTVNTQPALLTHSIAALRLLEAAGVRASWSAGHSLGEYSACVAAGALEFEDALRLVHRRGELMHQAGIDRPGTMAAILGLDRESVERLCAEASAVGVVQPANLNAPGQVVISGEVAAIDRACEIAKAHGAKRAIRLDVGGAFHSSLMSAAAGGLAEWIERTPFQDARFPVIANVSGQPVTRAAEIRSALEAQLLGAVRWEDSMKFLVARRVEGFVEVGSGKVLRGLLRTIAPAASSWNVEDSDSYQSTLAGLGAGTHAGGGESTR